MSFSQQLAELFVKFTLENVDAISTAMEGVRAQLDGVAAAAAEVGKAAQAGFSGAPPAQLAAALQNLDAAVGKAQQGMAALGGVVGKTVQGIHDAGAASQKAFGGEGPDRMGRSVASIEAAAHALLLEVEGLGGRLRDTGQQAEKALKPDAPERFGKSLQGIQAQLAGLQAGVQKVGTFVQLSFLGEAAAHLRGFVQAGLGASALGQQLTFNMERLSRSIAGLFGPELAKAVDLVRQAVNWLGRLSDAQRTNIARWLMGGAAALAVVGIMPQVVAAIGGVIGGVVGLTGAFLGLDVATGGILPALGAVATAAVALAVGTEVGRNGIGRLWEAGKQAFGGLQALLAKFADAVQPVLDVAEYGFKLFTATGATAFHTLSAAVDRVLPSIRQVFEQIRPDLRELMNSLSELAEAFAELAAELLGTVPDAVDGVIGAMKAAIYVADGLTKALQLQVLALKELVAWMHQYAVLKGALYGAAGGLLTDAAEQVRKEMSKLQPPRPPRPDEGGRGPLPRAVGGPEAIDAIYTRLAQAAIRSTAGVKTPEERMLEIAREQLGEQKKTTGAVQNLRPAFVHHG